MKLRILFFVFFVVLLVSPAISLAKFVRGSNPLACKNCVVATDEQGDEEDGDENESEDLEDCYE